MLLERLTGIDELGADRRLRTVHHGWAEAAERTQQTVRNISEQLRRFTDDQVWLENRRVLDLVRQIETSALQVREGELPDLGLELEETSIDVALPTDRPLFEENYELRAGVRECKSRGLVSPRVDGAGPHRRRPAGVSGVYWSASTRPRASAEIS